MEVKLNEHKALRGIMELASCNCITKQIWNTEDTLLSNWVVPEKIQPPMEQITITPSLYPTILYKLKTFFSESPSTLSGQQKFPLWVGYRFFLERPTLHIIQILIFKTG